MNKFFVENNQIDCDKFKIVGEDVNHIKNVLRLSENDDICICNKSTKESYLGQILKISKDTVEGILKEKMEFTSESNVQIDVFQGLPKADKMELIIQKGTELRS